jgi:hypothetical protein
MSMLVSNLLFLMALMGAEASFAEIWSRIHHYHVCILGSFLVKSESFTTAISLFP